MDLNSKEEIAKRMQEYSDNYVKDQQTVEAGLIAKKHVLIESLPGMRKIALAKAAAEKIGLNLVHFELAGVPLPTTMPRLGEDSSTCVREEKEIRARLEKEKEKGNAILVDAFPKDDITAFVNAAKELNLQLIVCVTHPNAPETGLKISMYENRDDLKAVVDAMPHLNTQDFNPKIPTPSAAVLARMRISFASDLDDSNKPKPK